ncbi:class I SAM-dependent methyltransferase [Mycobacterium sp. CBMA293]|uniref:class I SAM-dependent methyltransferase n=1 Tax=unclassified Mycolicibacterium TaxID=2636767 RepID=UPI0012DC7280|nr:MULTISPECIES: class I SAM-dependent methyltransferase [unclassified Mycolicibacterium]MUL48577.1 class I SAM-dependent methyltransferase [Mycolicibacterium sp. CBMA 360]MUL62034.1 class I SAM-dependent methyltransferase [Mycolicibacterium sp. CBMA 335]MUL73309.1 class I SAM-dependent methyltransferase [Mycolicibacterium sp. CBMA 311]MUL96478.1 class I SAM-dependent methyltransferase [Mycolicibacterium sp. CBMA 230]MUM05376.1 SAM-dependent methyltransferase [Mycolicibacterium sp. CBMA 213]
MARTDGDSWDLASSVGATATMVAGQRALAHREQLIDDPYAEPLVRAVGVDFFTKALDGEIDLGDVNPAFTPRRAAEGMTVRTRFFDQVFLDAAAAGVRQAVILAAGLDARAYRLPWPAGTVVYEIDQPEVIEFKSTTLAGLGATPTAQRHAVAIDLRDDWVKALKDSGFDPSAPTAWIAEGLLIYLPPEAQDALFDNITALSAPGSFVACEQIGDMSAFDDERHKLMSERMKALGSNIEITDLIYQGDRNHVVDYLGNHSWDVAAVSMEDAYADNDFEYPDDEMSRAFGDLKYVRAVLTRKQ